MAAPALAVKRPSVAGRGVPAAILWGGLAAGVMDGSYAAIAWGLRGVAPHRVFQGVAAGLLGRDAFQGGLPTAALGLALHFFIALTAAAVYVLASTRLPALARRPVPFGVAYGLWVYVFMNFVVIPLSATRRGAFSWSGLLGGLAIHAFGVGLPIAQFARRAREAPPATSTSGT